MGTPPEAIGKFGGDTDNWIWPRHTGDFSVFRIYADENNQPAEYSEDNRPYVPKHHLPISLKGVEENDFTMIFGFPGSTNEYLLVDGNAFQPYYNEDKDLIPHKCFVQGDSKYVSIAAASILAKVYHDEYIDNLCDQFPDLEKYGWRTNMCYGTEAHLEAIKKYGITQYHRKTFGICQDY